MALQSMNGFDSESEKGVNAHSGNDSQKASVESIIRIFEEQMRSDDAEVRLNFVKALLSGTIDYASRQVIEYALARMLHISACNADLEALKLLLDNGVDANEPDIVKGMNALSLSMLHQDQECIAFLLSKGANLFAKLGGNETVLEFILQEASTETMQCIIDNSPSLCQDLMLNPNVFDACIEDGNPANTSLLLNSFKQQGVSVNVNPLILRHIAHHEDAYTLRNLCGLGFQIDTHDPSTVEAFYIAIKSGNADMVSALIAKGILTPDPARGDKALRIAIQFERIEIILQLIALGVDINIQTKTGAYPLLLAAETGNPNVFELIMEQKPDLRSVDLDELLEQMNLSMKILYPEIIDMRDAENPTILNQKGIDYDSEIDTDKLEFVSHEDCLQLLKTLMESEYVPEQCMYSIMKHGNVDINALVNDSDTLLHIAASKNMVYAIRVLLKMGADINSIEGKFGDTPLMKAIRCKQKEAAMLLIELGADCEVPDNFGTDPLLEAVSAFDLNHRVVVELLRAGVDDHGLIFVADN